MPPDKQSAIKQQFIGITLLILACVLPYLNTLHGEFVLDDVAFYVNNPSFTADHNLARFFSSSVWQHSVLHSQEDVLYRPLFMTAMWINQTIFGGNVVGHHLFNIGLHLTATLLLLQLLRRLLPDAGRIPPLVGALIFAVHPVHAEAVAWISAFGHLLATALLLGSTLCYLRHLNAPAWHRLGGSLALFALALLSGEIAVAFPLLIMACEYLRLRHLSWRRIAPFWLLLAVYFGVRKLVLPLAIPLGIDSFSSWQTAFFFAIGYLEQLLLPWPQFFYLAIPEGGIITPTGGALALLMLVGAAMLVRLRTPEKTIMLFGLAWIVTALSIPVIAALNPRPMFALRSLYLTSVGISILAAWAAAVWLPRQRPILGGAVILIIVVAIPTTWLANRDWLNNFQVYDKIFSISPNASGAAIKLADIYEQQGNLKMAEQTLRHATRHAPDKTSQIDLYSKLGLLYGTQGLTDQSDDYFDQVLKLDPQRSSAWVGRGNNAWARGNIKSALDHYLRAQTLDPNNREAGYNAALAYRELEKR